MSALRKQLNSDKQWLFAADRDQVGKDQEWFSTFPVEAEETTLSAGSGHFPDDCEIGWYCHSFTVDRGWTSGKSFLRFERASYYTEAWLNGSYLGDHEGGWLPFTFETGDALTSGENRLVVRVVYPRSAEGVENLIPAEQPFYGQWADRAGLLGSLTLLSLPEAHIEDLFVQPDLRRKRVAVDVRCSGCPDEWEILLKIADTDFSVRGQENTLLLDMPDFELWSPENPYLYRLEATLFVRGKKVDEKTLTFGMREFTLKDRRFHLNQRPLFIKSRACVLAPFYTLEETERQEAYRELIRETREAGFNMITLTGHPASEEFLSLADEEGMLLASESSLHPLVDSDYLEKRCTDALTALVESGRNHPSLVMWHLFNEERCQEKKKNDARSLRENLFTLVRDMDPSRLILGGGLLNDNREAAWMVRPYRSIPERYNDFFFSPTDPVPEKRMRYLQHSGEINRLCIVSGVNPLLSLPEDSEDILSASFEERGLQRIFGSLSDFISLASTATREFSASQMQAIRTNSKIAGYFCSFPFDTQDSGKTDADLKEFKEAQAPLLPLVTLEKHNLHPREATGVTVQMINETGMTGSADLSLQVIGPTGQVLWKKKRNIKLPRHGQLIWSGSVDASGALGLHRFAVSLMQGMKILARGEDSFHVFEAAPPSTVDIHLLDPDKQYLDRISAYAKTGTLLAPIHIIPPLGNTIRCYPDNDLVQILAQVREGALAIVFSPPRDWNDLAKVLDAKIEITSMVAARPWAPACHYVKLHPVFDKLPSRAFMREAYRNIAPAINFAERGEEDISGSLSLGRSVFSSQSDPQWGNNILVLRYGTGRIVMTHMPVLEYLGKDPVADRLFVNLLNHFERRSIPSTSPEPPDQRTVEWLRGERRFQLRRWLILGGIALDSQGPGKSAARAVETTRNFEIAQEGWHRPEEWRSWFTRADEDHELRLSEALDPAGLLFSHYERSAGYAYTEINCERRLDSFLRLRFHMPIQIWLNQQLVFENQEMPEEEDHCTESVPITMKHGRNTLLVKCLKERGEARFALDIVSDSHLSTALKWWK
ncbi:MAG: hypothetical protein GX130_07830 [Candidatus Hydrogenedens sp.]|jgi:hypothetical protein|nr:hypothetical protein [Candidatus Hydrogenedens sp.]